MDYIVPAVNVVVLNDPSLDNDSAPTGNVPE